MFEESQRCMTAADRLYRCSGCTHRLRLANLVLARQPAAPLIVPLLAVRTSCSVPTGCSMLTAYQTACLHLSRRFQAEHQPKVGLLWRRIADGTFVRPWMAGKLLNQWREYFVQHTPHERADLQRNFACVRACHSTNGSTEDK